MGKRLSDAQPFFAVILPGLLIDGNNEGLRFVKIRDKIALCVINWQIKRNRVRKIMEIEFLGTGAGSPASPATLRLPR